MASIQESHHYTEAQSRNQIQIRYVLNTYICSDEVKRKNKGLVGTAKKLFYRN